MHSKTLWNKQRYCGQFQSHVWIANFRDGNWKTSILWEFSYFVMVLWFGRSCKEMCGAILWVIKQDDSITLQNIYSMHRWPSLQRRRIELCRRIVTSMLSKCCEMFIRGTNWKTWYSIVSELTCAIDYKMDQSLWQTPESIDILHSSHMWIQTILIYWYYCKTMHTGTFSRLRFCRRSWGLKFHFWRNMVHFWKSYICSNKLDV